MERRNVEFTGVWKALSSIAQTPPGKEGSDSRFGVPTERVVWIGKAIEDDGDGKDKKRVVGTVDVPIIPGNKIRGLMRDLIAAQILRKFKPGTTDFDTLFAMTAGGSYSSSALNAKDTHELVTAVRNKNLLLDLLACATRQTGMMRGRLAVHNALAQCYETVEEDAREEYPHHWQLMYNIPFARIDSMSDWEVFSLLSEEGLAEMERQSKVADKTTEENKKKKKNGGDDNAEDNDEDVEGDDDKDKKEKVAQRRQINSTPAVAKGTEFVQRIRAWELLDAQIGAIVSVFREFQRRPYIGGYSNKGFGLVDVAFTARIKGDGGESLEFGVKDGEFYQTGADRYLAAWEEYLSGITSPEDIRIPFVPVKPPKEKKPKAAKAGGVKKGPDSAGTEAAPAAA